MTEHSCDNNQQMIATLLNTWHSDTVIRETNIEKALDKIDKHLEKLNGKVVEHERLINQLKIDGVEHIIKCPVVPKVIANTKDIDELKGAKEFKDLSVLNFRGNTTLVIIAINLMFLIFIGVWNIRKANIAKDVAIQTEEMIRQYICKYNN